MHPSFSTNAYMQAPYASHLAETHERCRWEQWAVCSLMLFNPLRGCSFPQDFSYFLPTFCTLNTSLLMLWIQHTAHMVGLVWVWPLSPLQLPTLQPFLPHGNVLMQYKKVALDACLPWEKRSVIPLIFPLPLYLVDWWNMWSKEPISCGHIWSDTTVKVTRSWFLAWDIEAEVGSSPYLFWAVQFVGGGLCSSLEWDTLRGPFWIWL